MASVLRVLTNARLVSEAQEARELRALEVYCEAVDFLKAAWEACYGGYTHPRMGKRRWLSAAEVVFVDRYYAAEAAYEAALEMAAEEYRFHRYHG